MTTPLPDTYERNIAMREGHRNYDEDEYFKARPQLDLLDRRNVFRAGFDRGWEAHRSEQPQSRLNAPAERGNVGESQERDSLRLRFLMDDGAVEAFHNVEMDRFEFAAQVAAERGREEATEDDELEGFRRLIDAAMAEGT